MFTRDFIKLIETKQNFYTFQNKISYVTIIKNNFAGLVEFESLTSSLLFKQIKLFNISIRDNSVVTS